MNKKSQVEAQFNWLYVLIIGGAIFAFLVFFGFRIKSAADVGYCNDLTFTLKDNIVNANYQSNYFSTIKIKPNSEINYDGLSLFCKGSDGASMDNYILFAQDQVIYDGNIKDMTVFTLSYEKPFFISNINYMVDSNYKYVLPDTLYDSLIKDFLIDTFYEQQSVIETIFYPESTVNIPTSPNDVFVNIALSDIDPTLDKELQLAKIISKDLIYDINHDKLVDRQIMITDIMLDKCNKIYDEYYIDILCYDDYEQLCVDISTLKNELESGNDISTISNSISTKNQNLALDTCVYLY